MLEVARSAGFCPGVRRAVDAAEKLQADGPKVMLGEIVHNRLVVDRLLAEGWQLCERAADCPDGALVLIRAHGVTAEELAILQAKGCRIVDQTCPFVRHSQKLVEEESAKGAKLILAGDPNHPEIIGIRSRSGRESLVISSAAEAEKLEFSAGPWILLAQTTFSVEEFEKIKEILKNKIEFLSIFDTICSTTVYRQEEAEELAKRCDLVLVLGAEHSSNTKKLYNLCSKYCRTILIQRPDQVPGLFKGRDLRQMRIGITAGASTPERMIREVIDQMTENEIRQDLEQEAQVAAENEVKEEVASEATEQAVSENTGVLEDDSKDINFYDYIEGIPQLKRGMTVKGKLIRCDDDYVYVDVRDKSEGKVPRHEFAEGPDFDLEEAVREHQEIDVYVRSIKNSDMGKEIILSKAKVDFGKNKELIAKAFEEKTPVTVKITNVVKDGVLATFGGVDLYIHRTQLDTHIVEDLNQYRGKMIEVLITQYEPNRKRLRVAGSRRALLSRDRRSKSKEIWENMAIGNEYDGVVRSLTDFGAFVDIGGVDGLVHVSELSWKRIKHPSEVVQVGDKIHVFIKDFDKEKKRVSLGFRRPENDPYNNIEERFPLGSIVRGIVVRMFPFGAFVEIAPGVDALCHISQISNFRLNSPAEVLKEGMEVDARVLEVSNEARKISISIKEVEPIDPENAEELMAEMEAQRAERAAQRAERNERRERRERRPRHEDEDALPTAYTDNASGTTLAALADFKAATEEGAETLQSLLPDKGDEA